MKSDSQTGHTSPAPNSGSGSNEQKKPTDSSSSERVAVPAPPEPTLTSRTPDASATATRESAESKSNSISSPLPLDKRIIIASAPEARIQALNLGAIQVAANGSLGGYAYFYAYNSLSKSVYYGNSDDVYVARIGGLSPDQATPAKNDLNRVGKFLNSSQNCRSKDFGQMTDEGFTHVQSHYMSPDAYFAQIVTTTAEKPMIQVQVKGCALAAFFDFKNETVYSIGTNGILDNKSDALTPFSLKGIRFIFPGNASFAAMSTKNQVAILQAPDCAGKPDTRTVVGCEGPTPQHAVVWNMKTKKSYGPINLGMRQIEGRSNVAVVSEDSRESFLAVRKYGQCFQYDRISYLGKVEPVDRLNSKNSKSNCFLADAKPNEGTVSIGYLDSLGVALVTNGREYEVLDTQMDEIVFSGRLQYSDILPEVQVLADQAKHGFAIAYRRSEKAHLTPKRILEFVEISNHQ